MMRTTRATLLGVVFAVTAWTPSCRAAVLDCVYTRDGRVLEGELESGTAGKLRLRRAEGTIELDEADVVAVERAPRDEPLFLVTETDPGALLEAVRRFHEEARGHGLALAAGSEGATPASPPDPAPVAPEEAPPPPTPAPSTAVDHARLARIAYERALVCLERLVTLHPDQDVPTQGLADELHAGLAMARKMQVLDLDLPVPPEIPEESLESRRPARGD